MHLYQRSSFCIFCILSEAAFSMPLTSAAIINSFRGGQKSFGFCVVPVAVALGERENAIPRSRSLSEIALRQMLRTRNYVTDTIINHTITLPLW